MILNNFSFIPDVWLAWIWGKSRASFDMMFEVEVAGIGMALGTGEPSRVTAMVDRWEVNTFSKA